MRILLAGAVVGMLAGTQAIPETARPPLTLQETGFDTDAAARVEFAPQYPLWTDGADKRRWIALPDGAAIDASDPDAWQFPVGTRLWKEFSFGGRRVETRYIERQADGQWLYAAYVWDADGREARLAPERGKRGAFPLRGGRAHTIPGVSDCKACHQGGGGSEVLGFSALQLASRLRSLVDRGTLVGLPASLYAQPPEIAATSATARAALGYLHGNCGHCHNETGALSNIGLSLRQSVGASSGSVIASTTHPVRKRAPGLTPDAVRRVEPAHPERSALLQRVASRYAPLQMPPLGTELVDEDAVALLRRWISETTIELDQKGPIP